MTALIGLVKIELPGAVTVRLCDGGYVDWGSERFTQQHATFGTIGSIDALGEGIGDEIPALEMVLLPAPGAAAGDLVQPGFQNSRARFWIAEYLPATNTVTGTPELVFDGQLDQCIFVVGRQRRELAVSVVSLLERLFEGNIGNSMNPTFHKSVWPGETGHDQATGLVRDIAWATELPKRGGGSGSSGTWSKGDFLAAGGTR